MKIDLPLIILSAAVSFICLSIYKVSLLVIFAGMTLFFYNFFQLFNQVGSTISIKELVLFFAGFQTIFISFLAYYVFPGNTLYAMVVEPDRYFSFVVPAVFLFGIGVNFFHKPNEIEVPNTFRIARFNYRYPKFYICLLIVGMLFTYVSLPGDLAFVQYFLSSLKFTAVFLQIIGSRKINFFLMACVYAMLFLDALRSASFHDFIIWMLFLILVVAYKTKPTILVKVGGVCLLASMVYIIQLTKAPYRSKLGEGHNASVSTAINSFEEAAENEELFSGGSFAYQLSRYNQGWIIARILKTVPQQVPFSNGETMWLYVQTALLPRILAPDKLSAGDKAIFNTYSGIRINDNTSMALSSVGDAYINFGIVGGVVFMFFYGLLFSAALQYISYLSKSFIPLSIISFFVFIYPVRIETATPTILTHLFKSLVLLVVLMHIFRRNFQITS